MTTIRHCNLATQEPDDAPELRRLRVLIPTGSVVYAVARIAGVEATAYDLFVVHGGSLLRVTGPVGALVGEHVDGRTGAIVTRGGAVRVVRALSVLLHNSLTALLCSIL